MSASNSANGKWHVAVSTNGRISWTDFLAIASDLQLVPRLVGVGALKAAVEEVSSAPHRVQKDGGLVRVHFVNAVHVLLRTPTVGRRC